MPARGSMSAEFNWWLLIAGIVAGGVLTWLVLADSSRRDRDVTDRELPAESAWIARSLGLPGVDADTAEQVLLAHRRYLEFPPPDVLVEPDELEALEGERSASGDPSGVGGDDAQGGDAVGPATRPDRA
jgi:hypothetical protein